MRNNGSLSQFVSCRLRLQRARDAKIMNGSLVSWKGQCVIVRLIDNHEISAGDSFIAEVHGPSSKIIFSAHFLNKIGDQVELGINGDIRQYAASELARIKLPGVPALVKWDGHESEVQIMDISKEGVGLLGFDPIDRNAMVEITIGSGSDAFDYKAQVRYCRDSPDFVGRVQVGLRLDLSSRLAAGKWTQQFEQSLKAA